MAQSFNPSNPANLGIGLATAESAGLMSAEDKARLDALSGSTEKLVCSTTVTIAKSTAAGSTTITLAEDCDYIAAGSIEVANGGSGKEGISGTAASNTDGASTAYKTVTYELTDGHTVSVSWSKMTTSYGFKNDTSRNINGYKYLI